MPLKNRTKFLKAAKPEPSHRLQNIQQMVRKWEENLAKGKDGEEETAKFLISEGFQVNKIFSWNYDKSEKTFEDSHREDTVFSPDFLATGKNEVFFADSKGKTKLRFLGMVNKADYDRYFSMMQKIEGIGFRIYFPIQETGEIYVLQNLIEPKLPCGPSPSDGRLCYTIPKDYLNMVGHFEEK